jgi:predicted RNase H-like nuclease
VSGKALSQQGFALVPKIRDIDEVVRADARLRAVLHEIHPELCFRALNGGTAMAHAKRTGLGFVERLTLLNEVYPGVFADLRRRVKQAAVKDDDLLDAMAALWTAERIAAGTASRIPEVPEVDSEGLAMTMQF